MQTYFAFRMAALMFDKILPTDGTVIQLIPVRQFARRPDFRTLWRTEVYDAWAALAWSDSRHERRGR